MARLVVEVAYAVRDRQEVVAITLEEGASVLDAFRASGLADRHPEIDAKAPMLGIFGNLVAPGTRVKPGDRVEIYRPLQVDPKMARHAKASEEKRRKRQSTGRSPK